MAEPTSQDLIPLTRPGHAVPTRLALVVVTGGGGRHCGEPRRNHNVIRPTTSVAIAVAKSVAIAVAITISVYTLLHCLRDLVPQGSPISRLWIPRIEFSWV